MRITSISVALAIIAGTSSASSAANVKPDTKFLKEVAAEVWGMTMPEFNAATPVPDSLAQGAGAVIIAEYNSLDARRIESSQLGNFVDVDRHYIGETTVNHINRCMVKILGQSAIDHFSTFSFRPKETVNAGNGIVINEYNQAFGARIHKPNGTIIDVDTSQPLTETEGKNEKAVKHKIAIPGLAPGDILEYFYYTRHYMFGNQGFSTTISFVAKYPVLSYRFDGAFDGTLTTEISTFNGIEANIFREMSNDTRNILTVHLRNIPRFDNPGWCNTSRQTPFVRLSIKDNLSRIFGTPESARRAGIYFNLPAPLIMAEVAEKFEKTQIARPDDAMASNIVKEYQKAHPQCSEGELADVAWLAANYVANVSKENFNDWSVVCLMKDILDKCKLTTEPKLAVTTAHSDIPVDKITSCSQASPLLIVGDRYYASNILGTQFTPGELPDKFHGETAYTFDGKRAKVFTNIQLSTLTLPDHPYRKNTSNFDVDVTIPDPDDTKLDFTYKLTAKGAGKSGCTVLMAPAEMVAETEDFLEMPDNKRSTRNLSDLTEAFDKLKKELYKSKAEDDLGLENASIDTVIVANYGYLPAANKLEYTVNGNVDELLSTTGNDLLIKIGAFTGANHANTDLFTTTRDIDICTPRSGQKRWTINLHIPEGYSVDPESLERMKVNITNSSGMLYAQGSYDSDLQIVKLSVMTINARRVHPATQWSDFLQLKKAARDFSDTMLLLRAN